ncbi:extracellular membrane associated protein [Cryptosporidium canis]|uniref:Extracellular membrane associated protein n=1 Tax=Cryptosporidium canis TaxID=195482 RepID=A0ABQ8P4B9_9CRYT|nr:extracellular membrane associated protein [Cryptosporidium canis]KAJ1614656.1 extracellular membrane associated protein [Cryptosporidium canis]
MLLFWRKISTFEWLALIITWFKICVVSANTKFDCPIGYAPEGNNCILCRSGTFSNSETNTCTPCGEGRYSFPGSYSSFLCFQCLVGTYSGKKESANCEACSNFQITSSVGSTKNEDCFCMPGYKPVSLRDETCTPCSPTEWCYKTTPTSGGFWNIASYCYSVDLANYSRDTTTYKICSDMSLMDSKVAKFQIPCFGGESQCESLIRNVDAIADININQNMVVKCTEGNTGLLCDDCEKGYAKIDGVSSEIYSCQKCSLLNFVPFIIGNLFCLGLIIYSVWILRLEPTANEEEMPIVQIAIIRTTIQHLQLLGLLFKANVINFEYFPSLSIAISYLGSNSSFLPLYQCIISYFGYNPNGPEALKLFSIITSIAPILLLIFALVAAPILRYFRQKEVGNFLLGRQEMEGECLQFQKSFFSWFFSVFIVSFFFYYSINLRNIYSVISCIPVNVDIHNPTNSLMSTYSTPIAANKHQNVIGDIPGQLLVVGMAKENICWGHDHWIAIFVSLINLTFWSILIPIIYLLCIYFDTKNDKIQRRRLVYGWWTSGYENSNMNIWEIFTYFSQILYLAVIFTIEVVHTYNFVVAYFAVPGGSHYEALIPIYTPILSLFCSIVMAISLDSIFSYVRPNDQDSSRTSVVKAEITSVGVEDELLTEDQKQKQKIVHGGITPKQSNKWSWNSYYYFIRRMSSFSIITAIFASLLPRLNVNIENKMDELRESWTISVNSAPIPLGYEDFAIKFFSIFSVFINYVFIFITLFSVVGIKVYRKLLYILSSKSKVDVNIKSMSDFANSSESINNSNKGANGNRRTSSIGNPFQTYHDMSKTTQIGDQDGERIDDEVSIEQLIRMHLRTDCLGFLSHEDRVSVVVAIKRCDNRQEGLAISLRATLDSRFGESGKFTIIENNVFICESLRSYGFSDVGMEKLIDDLLDIHISITNRIQNVSRNSLKMAFDLCTINYPEVAQKLGMEQIIPTELKLNLMNDKSNIETNNNSEALYSLKLRVLLARLSLNALILDISDNFFRIPRSIPISSRLKLNGGTGLLFSDSSMEDHGIEKIELGHMTLNDDARDKGYKVPIPGYIEEEYNEPRSLDVDLMLSIKKLTEGDPRTVLEETNYPLAFEKATRNSCTNNRVLETLFSLIEPEFRSQLGSSIELINSSKENNGELDMNQNEDIVQLLLGLNPDENIGSDAILTLLKDLETSGTLGDPIEGFQDKFHFSESEFYSSSENKDVSISKQIGGISTKHKNRGRTNDLVSENNIVESKNKMSLKLKNSIYNLFLLRVLDLKIWLSQYRKQYIEEANKKIENLRQYNYLNFYNNLAISPEYNNKNISNTSSSSSSNNDANKIGVNCSNAKHCDLVDSVEGMHPAKIASETKENLKMMAGLVSNLNRYASPSMLFYYLQLCKRLSLNADFTMTSLIPDSLLYKGIISNEEAIRLYREINPSLNFYDNPIGFDVATIHEFSALNTPNLNIKRELELTIERQREFNMIFPSALPCIHSIFWVPFDIYDDDNLWINQSKERQSTLQLLEILSKDHPQIVELPYIDEEMMDEKLECVELDKNDKGLLKQTLYKLLPQVSNNGRIEDGSWLWSELPIRFAIDLNGLSIRKLYSSSNYQKSIYLSGSPLSVLGPQSPQWAFMSHKSERINYLNGICTLNYNINNNNVDPNVNVGDQAIIISPGIEVKGTSFTIEVWVKLPQLFEKLDDVKQDKESDSDVKNQKSKSKSKSKSRAKVEGRVSSKSKSKRKKLDMLSTNKDKNQSLTSLGKIQKKLAAIKGNADEDVDSELASADGTASGVDKVQGEADDESNAKKRLELPTLQVLCSTDAMEGLFTVHRSTGTIGFWDSNGRFLKCIIKNDPKDANKNEFQYKNSSITTSSIATLQSIYSQLGLIKKSTYCKETNQDLDQFIDYDEDPMILDPWVLVHIVYNMGSIKYFVNGRYIGSIRKPSGLKGDISVIGGGLESGSGWGYFSQFRVYGTHTSNEQIKKRYESYVSLNSDNSFITKINKLTATTINWALTLWRSGAVGFFVWKYSQINLKQNDITYLIELINRKNSVLINGDIVDELEKDNSETKNGILLFGVIIRILKGERSFPYYFVYEPLPYIEKTQNDLSDTSESYNTAQLSIVKYKMTSITSQLGYRVTEDYKKIKLDNEQVYRLNPLLYQPSIVPGPGMSECLLLAFNTKSNNSGLLITPPIELQRKVRSKTRNTHNSADIKDEPKKKNGNMVNDSDCENDNSEVSELYNGWTITVWFHYPLLTNYSYTINNSSRNEEMMINNPKKKSTSDIDHYIVLVTGKNDSHIVINENMDVGVYKNFSHINNNISNNNNYYNNNYNYNTTNNNINYNYNNYSYNYNYNGVNNSNINININNSNTNIGAENNSSSNTDNSNYNCIDKGFYSSGLNLNKSELPIGWHMLTVVGKPRMEYIKAEGVKERNIVGGGGLGFTEITKPIQKNINLLTQYKWCQEFYIDGQIMGISSYCTHESIVMIGNSLFLENAFGIFTCPRVFSHSFSPMEIHTDFLSYNYLVKAGSWNPKDDILLQFDYNVITKEFRVLENPSNKLRYIYSTNSNYMLNKNDQLKGSAREKKRKKKKQSFDGNIEIDDQAYWLDEMECQSPLFNYIETFLDNNSSDSDNRNIMAISNFMINQCGGSNCNRTNENKGKSGIDNFLNINNSNKDEICQIDVKNNGIITIHRGPTNENICIDPTQIFILEKKSGYSTEGGSVVLERPVRLSKNWSCEVWFYVPFETTYHPYCLISNSEGIGFIVIGLNGELGSIQRKITNTYGGNDIISGKNKHDSKEIKGRESNNRLQFLPWDVNLRDHVNIGWYHMVVTFNTTQYNTISIYINSQCIGKKMNILELPHHQSPWIDCIGNLKTNKGNYIAPFGLFGHLKIYDFALSTIEVGLLYKSWMCHRNLKKEILNRHIKQEKSAMTKIYTYNNFMKIDEKKTESQATEGKKNKEKCYDSSSDSN